MMAQDRRGTSEVSIGRVAGLLRLGVIVGFEPQFLRVKVYIGGFKEYNSQKQDTVNVIYAQLPLNHFSIGTSPPRQSFVGGYPESGTPVVVGLADGGQWFILAMLAKDPGAKNTTFPPIPDLTSGTYILQNETTSIQINKIGIILGENNNALNLDTKRDTVSNTFDNNYIFTEAGRDIDGVIFRDILPNSKYASSLRETSIDFNDTMKVIAWDPVAKESWSNIGSSVRNPSRNEKREVIYEFARSFNIQDNQSEFNSYKDQKNINVSDIFNRRESRADALSLSLVAPNYLMETIKGTVVDIYGNILDINRSIIPLGKIDKLSIKNIKTNLDEHAPLGNVFANMKALERREIAYHFELNAKKDSIGAPNISDRSNYARLRSRFFFDIDKEGMLKLNIPASSEKGNIPLLTRYENYSTTNPNSDTNDPNDLTFNQNSQDIMIESFIGDNAVISIIDELDGNTAPLDRFSDKNGNQSYIKHGTAYHNIANTLSAYNKANFQNNNFNIIKEGIPTTFLGRGMIADKTNIVNTKIIASGDNANAGGRSASLNFDGSIDLNVGANTIDRHSLWADFQGAIMVNVGRDITPNNISAALHFDGEVLIQSGGKTFDND